MGIMRSVTEAPDDGNELTWPRRTVKKALKNPESPPHGGEGGRRPTTSEGYRCCRPAALSGRLLQQPLNFRPPPMPTSAISQESWTHPLPKLSQTRFTTSIRPNGTVRVSNYTGHLCPECKAGWTLEGGRT